LRNFTKVSAYVLSLYALKPIECFLLKCWVGQISSENILKIINSRKLNIRSIVIASEDDKNDRLEVINQLDVSKYS
jgi:hypothetical protein